MVNKINIVESPVCRDLSLSSGDFKQDCMAGVCAYDENGKRYPLTGCKGQGVKFVAGLWRVQRNFSKTIIRVRDKDFVLGQQLPHQERTKFVFFEAYTVCSNCYGYYIMDKPGYVVAKYETKDGVFMGYGNSIESARAFLGLKLYDEYQDIIHAVLNGKEIGKTK